MIRPYLLFAILLFSSCRSTAIKSELVVSCAGFDIRQCQTDKFASQIPETGSKKEREEKMLNWLQTNGVKVAEVSLKLDFHEGVCEACDLCPTHDRYFIRIEGVIPDISSLRLLNFTPTDC